MPRKIKQALSDARIRSLKPKARPFPVTDGDGLFLLVHPSGAKSWRFSYYLHKRQKRLCLGSYPEIGLKRARELTAEARAQVAAGGDPCKIKSEKKRRAIMIAENTFEAIARRWLAEKAPFWSLSHAEGQLRRLEKDIFPLIGAEPIAEMKAPILLEALKRVLTKKGEETAKRARGIIQRVFRYAVLHGFLEADPTTALKDALPAPKHSHYKAPRTPKEVGAILRAIDTLKKNGGVVQYALRLHPYLAVRPGELERARWADIDFEAKEWRFNSSKTQVHHFVPLSRQVLEILEELKTVTGRHEWLFPNLWKTGRHISSSAMRANLARAGITPEQITPHGWRSVFRTLGAEECGISFDILEAQLAHAVPDVLGRAYNRTEWKRQRREAMQKWADYLDGLKNLIWP